MSQSAPSSSYAISEDRREEATALGSRENFWGKDESDDPRGGHSETTGTSAASYIARQLAMQFVDPICKTTIDATPNRGFRPHFAWLDGEPLGQGSDLEALHKRNEDVPLTEPCLYLPKQHDTGNRTIEYRQHRLRRRYNKETGYINFNETTSTAIPQFPWEIYEKCVHTYLRKRLLAGDSSDGENGLTITNIDEYLNHAKCLWHDPNLDSQKSLEKFVAFVREQESGDGQAVSN